MMQDIFEGAYLHSTLCPTETRAANNYMQAWPMHENPLSRKAKMPCRKEMVNESVRMALLTCKAKSSIHVRSHT